MQPLNETTIICPYCSERISVLINVEEVGDHYIEDCQVCCRPITLSIFEDAMGEISVTACGENEA